MSKEAYIGVPSAPVEVTALGPARNWYKLGDYLIDINSVTGISPLTECGPNPRRAAPPWFQIYLTSASYIVIAADNAKALRLNLIEIIEAVFGRAGTIDGCPF